MRRLCAFLTALAIFAAGLFGYARYVKANTKVPAEIFSGLTAHYSNLSMKTDEPSLIIENLNEDSIVIGGSSELSTDKLPTHPANLLGKNGYDMQTMIIGRGHYQSLMHAITIGAIERAMPNRKAVLIISAQWFTPAGIEASAFTGQFSPKMYELFMENPDLSDELKHQIAERTAQLYPAKGYAMGIYQAETGNGNPLFLLQASIDRWLAQLKFDDKVMRFNPGKPEVWSEPIEDTTKIDWAALVEQAEIDGAAACTNNDFGINNKYYDEYIASDLDSFKGYNAHIDYSESPEYGDLALYIKVCREAGIEPMIVLVPMNARWEDYAGFGKEKRDAYYDHVRAVCEDEGAVLADFSDKEDELYFLSDVMHLGWEGWVEILEVVSKYARKS